eukprot:942029-Prorocentrum_minimum.AAC.1
MLIAKRFLLEGYCPRGLKRTSDSLKITFPDVRRAIGWVDSSQGVGTLRVKSSRGRGGIVDGVTFEDIRGRNVLYAIEFYLW